MSAEEQTENGSNIKKRSFVSVLIRCIPSGLLVLAGVIISLTGKLFLGGFLLSLGVVLMLVLMHKEEVYFEGECPYCKSAVASLWDIEGIHCQSCNKRIYPQDIHK